MKGLAFAYDADRCWVEIVERSEKYTHKNVCNFSQVMLRIKDKKSIPFYRDLLQMTVVREMHFPKEKGDSVCTSWHVDTRGTQEMSRSYVSRCT